MHSCACGCVHAPIVADEAGAGNVRYVTTNVRLATATHAGARVATQEPHGDTPSPHRRLLHCRPGHRRPQPAAGQSAGRHQGQRRCELQVRRPRTVSGRHDRQPRAGAEHQQPLREAAAPDVWRTGGEERVVLRRNRRAESRQDASRRQEYSAVAHPAGRVRRAARRRRLHGRCGADVHSVLAQQPAERGDIAADRLRPQHVQRQRPDAVLHRPRHRLPGARLSRRESPRVPA